MVLGLIFCLEAAGFVSPYPLKAQAMVRRIRVPSIVVLRESSPPTIPEESPPTIPDNPQVKEGTDKISRLIRFYNFIRPIIDHGLLRRKRPNRIGGRAGDGRKRWMKSVAFQSLMQWAFSVCDADKNGQLTRDELYSGILLVHLHLAKYIGIAACQPLNRTQVDELFDVATSKTVGKIGINEFEDIAVLSCTRITSRVMVYWVVLVGLVPFLTSRAILVMHRFLDVTLGRYHAKSLPWLKQLWIFTTWLAEHSVSVAVFTAFVPWLYTKIDSYYAERRKEALKKSTRPAWEAFREKYMTLPLSNDSGKDDNREEVSDEKQEKKGSEKVHSEKDKRKEPIKADKSKEEIGDKKRIKDLLK